MKVALTSSWSALTLGAGTTATFNSDVASAGDIEVQVAGLHDVAGETDVVTIAPGGAEAVRVGFNRLTTARARAVAIGGGAATATLRYNRVASLDGQPHAS